MNNPDSSANSTDKLNTRIRMTFLFTFHCIPIPITVLSPFHQTKRALSSIQSFPQKKEKEKKIFRKIA